MSINSRQTVGSILGRVAEAFRESVADVCLARNTKSIREAREVLFFLVIVDRHTPDDVRDFIIKNVSSEYHLSIARFFNAARRAYLTGESNRNESQDLVASTISALATRLEIELEREHIQNIDLTKTQAPKAGGGDLPDGLDHM